MAIGSFLSGFVGGAVDTVKGLGHVIAHPVETAEGLGHAIAHPVETYEGIKSGVEQAFSDDPAKASGRAVFEVLTLFGPAALTKVSKAANVAKAAKVAEATAEASKTAEVAADIGKVAKTGEVASDAGKAAKTTEAVADAGKTAVAPEFLQGTKRLPTEVGESFGHGMGKHGLKTPEDIAKLRQEIKPAETVTWFKDEATLKKAAAEAPEALKEILAKDPAKLKQWESFLSNPKEGKAFGFRFNVPGEQSLGAGLKNAGGAVEDLGAGNTAYVSYKWTKAKGGVMEPKIFTIYPVAK